MLDNKMPYRKDGQTTPTLLVLCQLFYPELVSTGQTLTELCEELAEMGADIEVICAPPTIIDRKSNVPKLIEYKNIRIRRVWGTRFPKLNLLGRTINQVTFALSVFVYLLFDPSRRPILVLTNPPFLAWSCAVLRSLKVGKPYIYLIFDVYPDTAIKLGVIRENGLISKLWTLANRFTFKHAEEIVVIGRCMRDIISEQTGMSEKIRTIHVWADDRLIKPIPKGENPYVKKWGLKGKFVVSYSGNMGRFHDMEAIMEAAKILKDHKDIIFMFIGEGHKKQWAVEFARRWRLGNCQFHSYVDREDLPFSLSCADVGLVSLLRGQEGLSVPSKTYGLMAAGVPVIAVMSSQSEIARMLTEEGCGIVVEPGNAERLAEAILNLYNDRQKLALMGKNARRAIDNKYNLHSAAEAYYELIQDLNAKYTVLGGGTDKL